MTDDEWDDWEEWIASPKTQAFVKALASQSKALKVTWSETLWNSPHPNPSNQECMDLKARSQVFGELSELDRQLLGELLSHEHDRN